MSRIFITSDWHFCHDKSFIYEPRGFSSVQEMNETIINNHNKIVTQNDIVYCLGDCMLNNDKEGCNCIRRLNGQIFIIGGNHCSNNRIQLYDTIRYNISYIGLAQIIKYKGYNFYLSHYPTITSNMDVDKPLKRRVINLCGHSHTQDPFADWDKGLIFHTELDTNNCYPWLIDDVIEQIKNKIGE